MILLAGSPHALACLDGRTVSTLDLTDTGLTLLIGPPGRACSQAVVDVDGTVPVAVHSIDVEAPARSGAAPIHGLDGTAHHHDRVAIAVA